MTINKLLMPSLLIVGLAFSSCDDFLTQMPRHELTMENAVRDYESAQQLVNGMYSTYEYASQL